MTPDQFASDVLDLSLAVTKVVVAISPALVALAPVVLPRLAASFRNKRHGQAFETVSRMGLLATNVAAAEIRAGLGRAAALDSPGGPAITKEEMSAIMLKAAAAAFDWAKEQKVLTQVLAVYGGEEAVVASLSAIVHDKLSGSPVGAPSESTGHGQAFETVHRMGLLATNAAATGIRTALGMAVIADRPGGALTKDEMAGIVSNAVTSSLGWAREQKVLARVMNVFGGEEAVRQSLSAIVHAKLSGSPVGLPPALPPPPLTSEAAFLPVPTPATLTLAQIAEKQWNFNPEKK